MPKPDENQAPDIQDDDFQDWQPIENRDEPNEEEPDHKLFKALRSIVEGSLIENEEDLIEEDIHNAGNSVGAIKGWETRRRGKKEAKNLHNYESVNNLVDKVFQGEYIHKEAVVPYIEVSKKEAVLLGVPNGFEHAISSYYVRHIFKSHGNEKIEQSRGQIAVTPEDIKKIPYFIAKSHAAQHGGKHHGADTVRYFYDSPEGTTTVVEEVRKSGKMVAIQLIKFKKKNLRNVPNSKK